MQWFKQKTVLVPFDFSDESAEALKVAMALVEKPEDVHVLHVLIPLPVGDPYVVWDEQSERNRMEHAKQSIQETLTKLDFEGAQLEVRIGNASDTIAEMAEEIGAGLIVIPSHGRTGVKRLLLGSVTERVVRLAHCPVLVLKQPA